MEPSILYTLKVLNFILFYCNLYNGQKLMAEIN